MPRIPDGRGSSARVRTASERASPLLLFVGLAVLLATACLPGSDRVAFDRGPVPPSCGNGMCEPSLRESCFNCPADCPCCGAVSAVGGKNPETTKNAVGRADGKLAELAQYEAIDLVVGREIIDAGPAGTTDFELIGTVTGSGISTTVCPGAVDAGLAAEPKEGVVLVKVLDAKSWRLVGVWTSASGSRAFDLACGPASQTYQVRLEVLAKTTVRIDALTVTWKSDEGKIVPCNE